MLSEPSYYIEMSSKNVGIGLWTLLKQKENGNDDGNSNAISTNFGVFNEMCGHHHWWHEEVI